TRTVLPKYSTWSYSSLALQFGAKAYSTPTPSNRPLNVLWPAAESQTLSAEEKSNRPAATPVFPYNSARSSATPARSATPALHRLRVTLSAKLPMLKKFRFVRPDHASASRPRTTAPSRTLQPTWPPPKPPPPCRRLTFPIFGITGGPTNVSL